MTMMTSPQESPSPISFDIPVDPPSIHRTSEFFNFQAPPFDPNAFAVGLVDAMVKNNGLGLAAPQIGVNYRVIAVRANPMLVLYNPRIIEISAETIQLEEGCLSYPGIYTKVTRPRAIRVRYTEANGISKTVTFNDITARVIQHEIDHLDGVSMIDRAKPIHKEQALRKLKQLKRKHN